MEEDFSPFEDLGSFDPDLGALTDIERAIHYQKEAQDNARFCQYSALSLESVSVALSVIGHYIIEKIGVTAGINYQNLNNYCASSIAFGLLFFLGYLRNMADEGSLEEYISKYKE